MSETTPRDDAWYYAGADERFGPFSEAQLRDLVRSGAVPAETKVWHAGLSDWQPAHLALGLARPRATPPPIPPRVEPRLASLGTHARVALGLSALLVLVSLALLATGGGAAVLFLIAVPAALALWGTYLAATGTRYGRWVVLACAGWLSAVPWLNDGWSGTLSLFPLGLIVAVMTLPAGVRKKATRAESIPTEAPEAMAGSLPDEPRPDGPAVDERGAVVDQAATAATTEPAPTAGLPTSAEEATPPALAQSELTDRLVRVAGPVLHYAPRVAATFIALLVVAAGAGALVERTRTADEAVAALDSAVEGYAGEDDLVAVGQAALAVEEAAWTGGRVERAFGDGGPAHVASLAAAYRAYREVEELPEVADLARLRSEAERAAEEAERAPGRYDEHTRATVMVIRRFGTESDGRGQYEALDVDRTRKVVLVASPEAMEGRGLGDQIRAYVSERGEQPVTMTNRDLGGTYETTEYFPVYVLESTVAAADEAMDAAAAEARQAKLDADVAEMRAGTILDEARTAFLAEAGPHLAALGVPGATLGVVPLSTGDSETPTTPAAPRAPIAVDENLGYGEGGCVLR